MVRRLISLSLVMTCLGASSAMAQSGVIVDPNSPAGKEYAIPVDRARHDAGVDTSSSNSSSSSSGAAGAPSGGDGGGPALFGAGITPAKSAGNTKNGRKPGAGGASTNPKGNGSSSGQGSSRVTNGSPAAFSAPHPSSGAVPWLLGIGGLVLLIGFGGGMLARRGRQPAT